MLAFIRATLIVGFTFSLTAFADRPECVADLRGLSQLAEAEPELPVRIAEFFLQHRRLPVGREVPVIETERERLTDDEVTLLFHKVIKERPEIFRVWVAKVERARGQFFSQRLRLPDAQESLDLLDLRENVDRVAPLLAELFHDEDPHRTALRAADRLVAAYLSAMRQQNVMKHLKTGITRPSQEAIFKELVRSKNNAQIEADVHEGKFNLDTLGLLIENLGGIVELEKLVQAQKPAQFANVLAAELAGPERMQRLKTALETKGGFLLVSVNAGAALLESQFATMLQYAEDRDYDIIVYPTNNITQGLDKRLFQHSRIHILTNTIKNSALNLRAIGIMPKNQNGFASLDGPSQFDPGSINIVGTPQLAHKVIATATNHLRSTTLWSTGSMSVGTYPFLYPVQGRTSDLARERHDNAFLVLEKTDRTVGLDGRGVPNLWHQPRAVEYRNHARDKSPGFTDLGREYSYADGKVVVGKKPFTKLLVSDAHEDKIDQLMFRAYGGLLKDLPPKSVDITVEDPLNNTSSCHHDFNSLGQLIENYRSGHLSIAREIGGFVQFDNTMAQIPAIRFRNYKDSNHSYWLKNILDKKPATHSVINGEILSELTMARDKYKVREPLEWILNHRHRFVRSLPPDIRLAHEQLHIGVEDPLGARVLPYGEPYYAGPEWRQTALHHHGHQGSNGMRASPRMHAVGNRSSAGGDSHQTMLLRGYMNIGTTTPKRMGYNEGGYSSWEQGCGIYYDDDGTKQLLIYNSIADAFYPREGAGFLPGKSFFGGEELRIIPNDNDIAPSADTYDQFSHFMQVRRGWGHRPNRDGN